MAGSRRVRGLVGLVGLVTVLAAATPAAAHPHVFVDHTVVVRFGAGGPEAVDFAWTFDDMFSSLIIQSFDTDKDKRFSPKEVQVIEQKHFGNLKDYQYFVSIRHGGRPLPITVRQFNATTNRGLVTYAFTVPVAVNGAAGEGTLEIVVDDPTFYTAFMPAPRDAVQVQAPPDYKVDCEIRRDARGFEPDAFRCSYRRVTR